LIISIRGIAVEACPEFSCAKGIKEGQTSIIGVQKNANWANVPINLTNVPKNFVVMNHLGTVFAIIETKNKLFMNSKQYEELPLHNQNTTRVMVSLSIMAFGLWLLVGMPV